jgi:hypothetical protein
MLPLLRRLGNVLAALGCAGLVAASLFAAPPRMVVKPAPAADDLEARVEKFARDRIGRKVGDGQCTALAIEALKAAGAKTTFDYGVSGPDADYQWGQFVARFDDARPGDVIQFRGVKISSTRTTRTPDGGAYTETRSLDIEHHTAVVAANLGGGKFKVLEQNVGAAGASDAVKQIVQLNELNLNDMTEGKVWIYRPVKK